MRLLGAFALSIAALYAANKISYMLMKKRIVQRQKWDLNICCGKTDGGGVNADIIKHDSVPNFIRTEDIYHLPFKDKEFASVLCSHTIEHVEDPKRFFRELERVGEDVVLVIPPLWDLSAVFNAFEHKWIFLSLKKEHKTLPRFVRLPLSNIIHKYLGQKVSS